MRVHNKLALNCAVRDSATLIGETCPACTSMETTARQIEGLDDLCDECGHPYEAEAELEKARMQLAAQTARAEAATDSAVVLWDARDKLREQVQALGGEPCA